MFIVRRKCSNIGHISPRVPEQCYVIWSLDVIHLCFRRLPTLTVYFDEWDFFWHSVYISIFDESGVMPFLLMLYCRTQKWRGRYGDSLPSFLCFWMVLWLTSKRMRDWMRPILVLVSLLWMFHMSSMAMILNFSIQAWRKLNTVGLLLYPGQVFETLYEKNLRSFGWLLLDICNECCKRQQSWPHLGDGSLCCPLPWQSVETVSALEVESIRNIRSAIWLVFCWVVQLFYYHRVLAKRPWELRARP